MENYTEGEKGFKIMHYESEIREYGTSPCLNHLKNWLVKQHKEFELEWMKENLYAKCYECGKLKPLNELVRLVYNRGWKLDGIEKRDIILRCKDKKSCI